MFLLISTISEPTTTPVATTPPPYTTNEAYTTTEVRTTGNPAVVGNSTSNATSPSPQPSTENDELVTLPKGSLFITSIESFKTPCILLSYRLKCSHLHSKNLKVPKVAEKKLRCLTIS